MGVLPYPEDVCSWLYSVGILVTLVAFVGALHWPAAGADLWVGREGEDGREEGVLMLNVSSHMSIGQERRKFLKRLSFAISGRPISVSAVPFGPGIDIRRSCRFIVSLIRASCALPLSICGFLPCGFGANHCRMRGILVGKRVGMGTFLGLERLLRFIFSMSFGTFLKIPS